MTKQTAKHSPSLDWNQWGIRQGCGKLKTLLLSTHKDLFAPGPRSGRLRTLWCSGCLLGCPSMALAYTRFRLQLLQLLPCSPPRWQTPSCWGDDKAYIKLLLQTFWPWPLSRQSNKHYQVAWEAVAHTKLRLQPLQLYLAPCQGHDIHHHRW